MSYTKQYLAEAAQILAQLDAAVIDRMVQELVELRDRGGRLFILGSGGGAGHASHAVNDFRKIAGIEAYSPTDNVSELTARVNDDGWETQLCQLAQGQPLKQPRYALDLFGGGRQSGTSGQHEPGALPGICPGSGSLQSAASWAGMAGYTAQVANACVIVPTVNPSTVTPHVESFQAVVWHLLVSHPDLQAAEMKWESVK